MLNMYFRAEMLRCFSGGWLGVGPAAESGSVAPPSLLFLLHLLPFPPFFPPPPSLSLTVSAFALLLPVPPPPVCGAEHQTKGLASARQAFYLFHSPST